MNKRNGSGYVDLTAHEALSSIAKSEKTKEYKPLVYIASPYAGNVKHNVEQAKKYCRFAVSQGCIPLAPHLLYPQFMDDSNHEERELGLFFALVLLGKADELWVFGDRISKGMAQEIAKAKRRGMEIKHFGEVAGL